MKFSVNVFVYVTHVHETNYSSHNSSRSEDDYVIPFWHVFQQRQFLRAILL